MKKNFLRTVVCLLFAFLFVLPAMTEPAAAAASTAKLYTVNVSGLHMRSTPDGTEDNIVMSLPKGTRLIVVSTKRNWYKVSTSDGTVGWVFNSYLKYYGAVTRSSVAIANTTTTVRKTASTKARSMGKMKKGMVVIVRQYNSTWAKIQSFSGRTGYVSTKLLDKAF